MGKASTGARTTATAWALLAVSTQKQVDTLDDQRTWAERTASERGWTLTHTVKGVATAKAGPRTVVRDLLAQLRALEPADRPAWVLMIRLDRVARGTIADTQLVFHDLKMLGVSAWTREDGEIKIGSAMEQLIVAAKAAVATQENEVKRDKMLAFFDKRRRAGLPLSNQRPLGLRRGADGTDEPDEPYAEVIRTLFRLRIEGTPQRPGPMGLGSVARELLAITPPYTFKNKRTITIRWTPVRVRKVLHQRAYVEAGVVDELTFVRAQRVGNPGRIAGAKPLAGALTCWCGKTLTSTTWGRAPRRIPYYVCRAVWNHGTLQLGHRADRLIPQFVALLERLAAEPDLVAAHSKRARTVSVDLVARALREAEAALPAFTRERERVWALNAAGKLRDEDLQDRLDEIAARRAETETRIAELRTQAAVAQHERQRERDARKVIAAAARTFVEAEPEDQRRIARAVAATLGGLVVEADGTLVVRSAVDAGRQKRKRQSRAE